MPELAQARCEVEQSGTSNATADSWALYLGDLRCFQAFFALQKVRPEKSDFEEVNLASNLLD